MVVSVYMHVIIRFSILSVLSFFALGFLPALASAECEKFPKYPLWKTLTHERATSYVDRKLKGDWTPYTDHLEKQLSSILRIITAGKSAKLRHNGEVFILSGEKLSEYYQISEKRLEVVKCLAEESIAASLDSFATAAGGNTTDIADDEAPDMEVKNDPQVSGAANAALKIEVSTSCSNGVSRFMIRNNGPDWPKSGAFSIYRIDGGTKNSVSSRRMRLKSGQSASFTVKKSRNPTGNLGLFVEPTWYERSFVYDATLTCN